MPADTTVQLRIEVKDDGSLVLQRVAGGFENLQQSAVKTQGAFSAFGARLVELNAGLQLLQQAFGTARRVFEAFFADTIRHGARLQDLSRTLSIPVETLSKFEFAAKVAGVEVEQLGFGIKAMRKEIAEAQNPSSAAAKNLAAFGITAKDVARLVKEDAVTQILFFAK